MPRSHDRTMSNLTLQRRHYQFISDTIAEYRLASQGVANPDIGQWFAAALRGTNGAYDADRFIAACGPVAPARTPCLLCQSEND
jgi:hypothetical protein